MSVTATWTPMQIMASRSYWSRDRTRSHSLHSIPPPICRCRPGVPSGVPDHALPSLGPASLYRPIRRTDALPLTHTVPSRPSVRATEADRAAPLPIQAAVSS